MQLGLNPNEQISDGDVLVGGEIVSQNQNRSFRIALEDVLNVTAFDRQHVPNDCVVLRCDVVARQTDKFAIIEFERDDRIGPKRHGDLRTGDKIRLSCVDDVDADFKDAFGSREQEGLFTVREFLEIFFVEGDDAGKVADSQGSALKVAFAFDFQEFQIGLADWENKIVCLA